VNYQLVVGLQADRPTDNLKLTISRLF